MPCRPRGRCYRAESAPRARTTPTVSEARDSGSTSPKSSSSSSRDSVSFVEQRARDAVEKRAVLRDDPERLVVGEVGQAALLLVAQALGLLGEGVVVGAHRPRHGAVAHAVFEDHRARERRHLLEVVRRAVRDASEDDLLRGTAGERHDHPVDELLLRVEVALLLGQMKRVSQRVPARDDRRLLHRRRVSHQVRHQRVARLVVGEDPLLLVRDHAALLQARDHAVERVVEVVLLRSGCGCAGRRRSPPRCRCSQAPLRSGPRSGARSSRGRRPRRAACHACGRRGCRGGP